MSLAHSRRCADILCLVSRSRPSPCHRPVHFSGLVHSSRHYATDKPKAKDDAILQQEKAVEQYELLRMVSHQLPTDPWAQPIPTLDLYIPSLISKKKGATLSDHVTSLLQTLRNWVLNTINSRRMAKDNAWPGAKGQSPWSWKIFALQSTDSSAWTASLRKSALETYKRVNQAVAERDEKPVKQLSIMDMQSHYLNLIRGRSGSHVYVWKFHGERSPCRIVSIRAQQVHMGKAVRNNGSRLVVQALVKFDTLQSLEVYTKKGKLLQGNAEPKPVVEYLVFQKRLWYDSPWTIRDRFYEGLEEKFVPPSA